MKPNQFDIVVSGGGIAGLMATVIFARAGFSVLCCDPSPPVTEEGADGADLRTTAFLQPAQALLAETGLWDAFAPHATALQTMQIADATGPDGAIQAVRAFEAEDLSDLPFGWNLPNWRLRKELIGLLETIETATFIPGVSTASVLARTAHALVTLSDGTRTKCRLVIAADGRNSPVRSAAGIGVDTWRYGQKALAFAVTHSIPHRNVSTEIHRSGGPFTLVPLPDLDGVPRSAVVWMEDGPETIRLSQLSQDDFNEAATERSANLLGPLKLVGRRAAWPIISQLAKRFHAERIALIAEAAHVVPPIGAQGLNMSLTDIRTLRDLALASPEDLGSINMLGQYERARYPDVKARVTGIDLLNRTSRDDFGLLRGVRAEGIKLIHDIVPIRQTLMRAGLGKLRIDRSDA